jgi:hypothetical protein
MIELLKLSWKMLNRMPNRGDAICKEIGDAKFCILVDEARDESKKGANGNYFEVC